VIANQPAAVEVPPELQEWIDAEIQVTGLGSPSLEQKLLAALAPLPGLEQPSISGDKVFLRYDPVLVTKAQICATLREADFEVAEVLTAPSSPVVDATNA
jgi:hypothetical protein